MSPESLTIVSLAALILMVVIGLPIGLSLAATSLIGTYFLFESLDLAIFTAGNASFSILRNYIFATIPLFIIMGNLIARCGAASDLYTMMNLMMRRVPARLAIATVAGNAVFAAISGVSVAAAATFSQVAYPQMRRYNYHRPLALGVISGSAMLGMLIPPSILLIFWGILTETSIGDLFLAGVIPGLLLAGLFMIYLYIVAKRRPELTPFAPMDDAEDGGLTASVIGSGIGILGLIFVVIGGIWGGFFTPTEASGIGAIGGLVLAVAKGLRPAAIVDAIIAAGRTSAPIMFLLLTAALYSQFLVTSGAINVITDTIEGAGFGPIGLIVAMTVIWLLLGMILDSDLDHPVDGSDFCASCDGIWL
ncbi:TRAP transporter large permease subunit [Yoonia algicola]|uniref:TRAP transporter large permease subunit n=1 Tax=Yoonia algicola TaxID=3137368 RepID=A0AAN0MH19_9RHOB